MPRFLAGLVLLTIVAVLFISRSIDTSSFLRTSPAFHCSSGTSSVYSNTSDVCTDRILADYIRACGALPGDGFWEGGYFRSALCRLPQALTGAEIVGRCFRRRNVSRVMTIGDSNGINYFLEMVHHVKMATHAACTQTRLDDATGTGDNYVPETRYFARGDAALERLLRAGQRTCHSCGSRELECYSNQTGLGFRFEHVSLSSLQDRSITIDEPNTRGLSAQTFQEFFFRYYVKMAAPDVIIIFLPFNHVKTLSRDTVERQIQYFIDIVDRHTRDSPTLIYWVSCPRDWPKKRPNFKHDRRGPGDRYDMLEINALFLNYLKPFLVADGTRMRGFFDLHEVSRSREHWSLDGVHYTREWYNRIAMYILQILCTVVE